MSPHAEAGPAAKGAAGRGRSARGEHRREVLLAAAADLLLRQGLTAVTHRAVATQADLPLAATTYYFASLQDLRDNALRYLADSWMERAQAVVRSLPPRLVKLADVAGAVVAVVTGAAPGEDTPADHLFVVYERYLEAGRHPRLRPLVVAYNDQLSDLVREVLRRGGQSSSRRNARLTLAVVDGALITALAEGEPPASTAAATLTSLMRAGRRTTG